MEGEYRTVIGKEVGAGFEEICVPCYERLSSSQ
jgi:hypothetical protein